MMHFITYGAGAVLGILLSFMGYPITTWQFWAVLVLMGVISVSIAASARSKS